MIGCLRHVGSMRRGFLVAPPDIGSEKRASCRSISPPAQAQSQTGAPIISRLCRAGLPSPAADTGLGNSAVQDRANGL